MTKHPTNNIHPLSDKPESSPKKKKPVQAAPKAKLPPVDKPVAKDNPTETLLSYNAAFSQVAEAVNSQLTEQGHTLFAENIRLSKDFFKCKTVSELLEWQARIFQLNSNAYLEQAVKLTETVMGYQKKISGDPENKG